MKLNKKSTKKSIETNIHPPSLNEPFTAAKLERGYGDSMKNMAEQNNKDTLNFHKPPTSFLKLKSNRR